MKFFITLLCFCVLAKAQFTAREYFQNHDFSKLYISKEEFLKIIENVDSIKLYDDKKWLNLLHYDGSKSEIQNTKFEALDENKDDVLYEFGTFFYSNDGKTNAKYELYETIFSIYIDKKHYANIKQIVFDENSSIKFKNNNDNLHAICRFPSRFDFLKQNLKLQNTEDIYCEDFNDFLKYINPKSLTIVFPAAYLNSPASMFGHSFLLINPKYNSRLLSYAINWAADVDENKENPIIFTFKGLAGGYSGKYSITPYYDMLKTYKDNENRDLYEYDLDFNDDEILKLLKHLWEIKDTESEYYFFDKNCSYNLLWLLENSKQNLSLRDKFFYYVPPSKTIQVMDDLGLVKWYWYRPSKLNIILALQKDLSFNEVKVAKKIASGEDEFDSITSHEYTVLALANELSAYYAMKDNKLLKKYPETTHTIASKLSKSKPEKLNAPKTKTSILKSNYPFRISFGYEKDTTSKKDSFILGLRPSMHGIYEDDEGFEKGTAIEFLNTDIRFNDKVSIKNINIISLHSLSDINYITHSPSYHLGGFYSDVLNTNKLNVKAMGGLSFIKDNVLLSYLAGAKFYGDGVSFDNALLLSFSYKANKFSLEYNKNFYKHKQSEDIFKGVLHVKIMKNFAFYTDFKHTKYKNTNMIKKENSQAMGGFYYYF